MPKLKATMVDRTGFGGLDAKIAAFLKDVKAAQVSAAATATKTSRAKVKRVRPLAPARPNRYHGLKDAIQWGRTRDGGVALDRKQLDADFKPWLVQEIGTGQRAVVHFGGSPNPVGRPKKGAAYVKTVKSQVGRRISPGLVFADPAGKFVKPGRGSGQQLYLRSQIKNAPIYGSRRSPASIRINKEIEGQHFVRDGAKEGFREYRTSVLAAARTQLKKKRR